MHLDLNHLNLPVSDLAEARALFEELLGFRLLDQRGDAIAVLTDGQGFTLVLSNAQRFGGEAPRYPEGFHVGFIVGRREQVDQQYERVTAAGLAAAHRPRKQHGSYGFYFTALDGILFEIASYESRE